MEGIKGAALKADKPIQDVVFEDVFEREPDDPHAPTTYAGIFDKLVEKAGGFNACTSEQLAGFDKQAREAVKKQG